MFRRIKNLLALGDQGDSSIVFSLDLAAIDLAISTRQLHLLTEIVHSSGEDSITPQNEQNTPAMNVAHAGSGSDKKTKFEDSTTSSQKRSSTEIHSKTEAGWGDFLWNAAFGTEKNNLNHPEGLF